MKMVYVNGIENIAINRSDIERLSKNFQISDEMRSPLNKTMIVIILLPSDRNAVIEYKTIRNT
jgi:hypothetical protein